MWAQQTLMPHKLRHVFLRKVIRKSWRYVLHASHARVLPLAGFRAEGYPVLRPLAVELVHLQQIRLLERWLVSTSAPFLLGI